MTMYNVYINMLMEIQFIHAIACMHACMHIENTCLHIYFVNRRHPVAKGSTFGLSQLRSH